MLADLKTCRDRQDPPEQICQLESCTLADEPYAVSKVEQIEAELQQLSRTELAQIRTLLDDMLEDDLEFTPEFEAALEQSEREKSAGVRPRTRPE